LNKTLSVLLALIIITATGITSLFSGVAGKEFNPIYTGLNVGGLGPQEIKFSVFNGSVLYNLGNLSIEFYAHQEAPENLQTLMCALYSVSYNASWQDGPAVIYEWSIHDLANISDDDPDPQQYFYYTLDLTNVPEGEHQIEVTAVGGGYVWGCLPPNWDPYYDSFTTTGSSTLYFTINASSPPAETPDFDSSILWRTNVLGVLSEAPAQDLWETDLQYNGRRWTSLTVVDDVVYAGAISTVVFTGYGSFERKWINVFAFNATTGAIIWNYIDEFWDMTPLAVADGIVYFGADDHVSALNASSGKLLWKGAYSVHCLAAVQGKVFTVIRGSVVALNASNGNQVWNFTTGDGLLSSPTFVNGVVYIGSNDANLYALNAENGEKIWIYAADARLDYFVAVANGVVYASSNDNVYALSAETGDYIWNYTTGDDEKLSSPVVADDRVYIGSLTNKVYALNTSDGSKIWNTTIIPGVPRGLPLPPQLVDGIVYARTANGVYGLDANNGAVIWNYTNTDIAFSSDPFVFKSVMYISSYDGQIYAIMAPSSPTEPSSEEPTETTEQFPTSGVIVACVTVIVAICLLFYFKKRRGQLLSVCV